jgi:hypothetical protein
LAELERALIETVIPSAFAQALLERGMLDGAISGVSAAFTSVGQLIQTHPYAAGGAVVVLLFFLLKGRR